MYFMSNSLKIYHNFYRKKLKQKKNTIVEYQVA